MRGENSSSAEVIVIGGGIVGAAVAYGLTRRGIGLLLLDGGDRDYRAALANFGIIWVQGKGPGAPDYQRLTRHSSDLWPDFARELSEISGIALDYRRCGGLTFCLGDEEFATKSRDVARMHRELGTPDYDTAMLERGEVERLVAGTRLGPDVTGAVHCWRDAEVNPLRLLQALHLATVQSGGRIVRDEIVTAITPEKGGFAVETANAEYRAETVVISAGNGSGRLAAQVGLDVPLRPQRGQLLVTERLGPLLPMPTVPLRQVGEGGIQIGSTQEEVGFDVATTVEAAGSMALRACRILPDLEDAIVVRHWSGLRVMSPDSFPIYAQSATYPGAFVALCHSGITLAPAHAREFAGMVADGIVPDMLKSFHPDRFHVSHPS